MYRCETCSSLFRTVGDFGDACPVDGSDGRSLRRLWLVIGCGDAIYRVCEFPFLGDRTWARRQFGGVPDGFGDLAYRYFPSEGELLRVEEDEEGLRLFSGTDETRNHVRVDDAPVAAAGSPLEPGQRLTVHSVTHGAPVMTLTVTFATFGCER